MEVGNMMKFEERVLKYEFELNDTDDQIIDYIRKNRHRHKLAPSFIISKNSGLSTNALFWALIHH